MQIHVLTGDCLADTFRHAEIQGEVIVSRECLIAGDVRPRQNLQEFWEMRATFIHEQYGGGREGYMQHAAQEYEKLLRLPADCDVHLWFEHDLFCQVNMWFSMFLLAQTEQRNVYRVSPIAASPDELWFGFGRHDAAQLRQCFSARKKVQKSNIMLGAALWSAYQRQDTEALRRLSASASQEIFPYLQEVCHAEIERKLHKRPETVLKTIMERGAKDFDEIFLAFSKQEGIYGFGDLQVKGILEQMRN